VVCIVEQQHRPDNNIGQRMFDLFVHPERLSGKTTGFVIFTGNSPNIDSYTETCFGFEASIKYRTFHLSIYKMDDLIQDKRPFAKVMYSGRLTLEAKEDLNLREKYAWDFLKILRETEYNPQQKRFILVFAKNLFWLKDRNIDEKLKKAYMFERLPLSEYSRLVHVEQARDEARTDRSFEIAFNLLKIKMSVKDIATATGLYVEEINDLIEEIKELKDEEL
jgi:hypothetical protein